jgi:hypothetical protein
MNFDETREIAIQLLRTQGKAKNNELLGLLGGDMHAEQVCTCRSKPENNHTR